MATTTQQSTRRVLGDLGVNNSNTSTKLQSPKTAKAVASLEVPAPSLALSPGKKRSIHEVDGAASTTGEARSGAMGRFEALEQAAKKSRSSDKEVINILSDDDSDPESSIHDDNVEPSIEQDISRGLAEETSQSTPKNSQSSQIDLTRGDEEMSEAEEVTTLPSSPPPQQTETYARAEMLRLRLRVAMFKVQTNQTDVPLSRLQISPLKQSAASSSTEICPTPILELPPASRQSQLPDKPRLLPAPILVPTAYSARQITKSRIPSSPPLSIGTSAPIDVAEGSKPATPAAAALSPKQLSSPPASQERKARDSDAKIGLTTTAVQEWSTDESSDI